MYGTSTHLMPSHEQYDGLLNCCPVAMMSHDGAEKGREWLAPDQKGKKVATLF
jgi:hypothetical protein